MKFTEFMKLLVMSFILMVIVVSLFISGFSVRHYMETREKERILEVKGE